MLDITDEEVRIHVNSCFMFNEMQVNVETEPLTERNSSKSRPVEKEIIYQQNSRRYCVNQTKAVFEGWRLSRGSKTSILKHSGKLANFLTYSILAHSPSERPG